MDIPIDINGILEILPHRHPFVLVDRIISLNPGKKVVGIKNVTFNEPFFPGHFPGNPIMPGVLILEAMGQAGGILVYLMQPEEKRKQPLYFTGLDKVRFRRPVVPGDQLVMELSMIKQKRMLIKMKGVARVEGELAAEAEMMAAWGEK